MNPELATVARGYESRIAWLRNEEASLVEGNGRLCAYGITSQVQEVFNRLAAIQVEARSIARDLLILGFYDMAEDAATGWAVMLRPREAAPR